VLIYDDDEGDEAGVLLGGTSRTEGETDLPKESYTFGGSEYWSKYFYDIFPN